MSTVQSSPRARRSCWSSASGPSSSIRTTTADAIDGGNMDAWVGQYCIYVTDLERALKLYEAIGLTCTSRTQLDDTHEAIVENPDKGGKLQLAQMLTSNDPIDMGHAFWKLY